VAKAPAATTSATAAKPAAAPGKVAAKQWTSPPSMTIDPAKAYTAVITTSKGPITVELLPSDAPKTVNNFVFLAREGFYDETIFHRTIRNFMIQGGDPGGTGAGGPGYRFDNEPVKRDYTRGILAMANAGPNTNGSQFFIMHQDYQLPKNYTIFGRVTAGHEALDAIATAPVTAGAGGEQSKPVEPARIVKVEIKEG
jgi:cyclophilin family peptidyl-prolyl cis-trans isomerase